MSNEKTPLHILSLEVSNVKRLRAVTITPEGDTILIGGRNGQGKSSILDSIEMALSGARAIPLEPVRHGTRKADVDVGLGNSQTGEVEFKIERTFTAKGTELVVRGADGVPKASPQKLLDSLCAKVTFDPLAFSRMEAPKQDELLKKMVGLDLSDLASARDVAYQKRAEVNKEVKRLEAVLKSTERHPGAPKQLVDIAALNEKLQIHRNAVGSRTTLLALVDKDRAKLGFIDEQIAKLERDLAEAKVRREQQVKAILAAEEALPPEPAPVDDLQSALSSAEATNHKVRANLYYDRLEQEATAKAKEGDELSEVIADLDAEKAERLAAVKFPIEGLGFDDAGPTFGGVPLAQASQAERLRLSVAIGAALNPRVKVMLIREGSLLDAASLALLAELAKETGAQCWIERVGNGDEGAIIIEDGSVLVAEAVPERTAGAA